MSKALSIILEQICGCQTQACTTIFSKPNALISYQIQYRLSSFTRFRTDCFLFYAVWNSPNETEPRKTDTVGKARKEAFTILINYNVRRYTHAAEVHI